MAKKDRVVSTPNVETQEARETVSEKYTATLRVTLTPEEVAERAERADRAAQMIAERDAKEEEHKAAAKHNKSVIEAMDSEIRRLSNEVRTRGTYRPVDCERVIDYRAGRLREVRLDTGEAVADRALTEAEKQRVLFNGDGEAEG